MRPYVHYDDDDHPRPTPAVVVAAVALGAVSVPFIGIYAVLFIVHGSVHPVVPPDITDTKGGELVAGIIAAVIFLASVMGLVWVVNGRRRWPFVVVQLGMLAATIYFLVDGTKGGDAISGIVALAAVLALVLILAPPATAHYRPRRPAAIPPPPPPPPPPPTSAPTSAAIEPPSAAPSRPSPRAPGS